MAMQSGHHPAIVIGADQSSLAASYRSVRLYSSALRIGAWLCLSAVLCLAVTASSQVMSSALGAPVFWTWALTGLQVTALWVAGRGHGWGWMVGSAVQPAWIAYAILTGQLGFVLGCAISSGVQLSSYLRENSV